MPEPNQTKATLTVLPAPPAVQIAMPPDAALRFQAALEWSAAKLGRNRGQAGSEHVRWLNWGSCLIAGEAGIAPPPPVAIDEKPSPTPEQLRATTFDPETLNGPVVDPENRADVVANQGEVDDLLASLGF